MKNVARASHRVAFVAALAAFLAGSLSGFAVRATNVVVRADVPSGASNQELTGVGWNTGTLDGVAGLEPHQVRIDASLQSAAPSPGVLDLTRVKEQVAAVRAIGAEPLVGLWYMPRWLGEPLAAGRDPMLVAPYDFDVWEALIRDVVRELATAPEPAIRFEVWNEPDSPIFWQDTPAAFYEVAIRTHRAVAAVAAETGLPLEIGGPAATFPDPPFMLGYLAALRNAGVPLDFVSWHYYGNYPFLGPDGAEATIPEPARPITLVWGQRNPATTPAIYGVGVELVRALTDSALAGSALYPRLMITEWNLSAGGHDVRNDSNVGAAFDAATLIDMERSGLDAADFYRASNSPSETRPGDWGLVRADGSPKPAWWIFRAWLETAGEVLPIEGDDPAGGLWARATASPGRIDVLLASFVATGGSARDVTVSLAGACAGSAEVRALSEASSDLAAATDVEVGPNGLSLVLPPESLTWVRFSTGCA